MRVCNKCKILKNSEEFGVYKYTCLSCKNIREKKRYAENREKMLENFKEYQKKLDPALRDQYRRKSMLKIQYNMTLKEYEQLFESQAGKCAICKLHQDELNHTLHVDHCHKNGKIRGLLCRNCNQGLGKFFDNKEIVENLLHYLQYHV